MQDNADIILICETKIDVTFPEAQFSTERISHCYRLDRIIKGGGILLYVGQNIPSKRIKRFFYE